MTQHYLQRELYDRIQWEPDIFDFLETSCLDGFWYWDLENPKHEWMSDGFWHLFGIDPKTKNHRAEDWGDIIHQDDLALALANLEQHLKDPSHPFDQLIRYAHTDGSFVTVRCRGMALRDKTGKPTRMIGVHTDVTSLKRTEADLAAANRDLAQQVLLARAASLAKDGFLSTMSHEVRTPLNAILGFFQLLNMSNLPERETQWAQKGFEAAETLLHTLNHVLEVSQLEAQKVDPKASAVRLTDVASQMSAMLEGGIAKSEKPVAFRVEIAEGLPERVMVDRLRLMQILNNLLDNAVKFTEEGEISAAIAPVAGEHPQVAISVTDTGIGIAPCDQDRIFHSFEQVQDSVTRAYGGAGLGLSISRDLAELMGGSLEVVSDGQSGTRFTLKLPLEAVCLEAAE